MGAGNFETRLGVAGTLAGCVAFEDDGAVEQVLSERKVEVRGWVGGEAEGLHGWELVDGCEDVWGWVVLVYADEAEKCGLG